MCDVVTRFASYTLQSCYPFATDEISNEEFESGVTLPWISTRKKHCFEEAVWY